MLTDVDLLELRDAILRGEHVELDRIRKLVERRTPEGRHLEYKRGPWIQDRDGARGLCQWISGFANADGGLLVVGAADGEPDERLDAVEPWTLTGCGRVGKQDLASWVSNSLGKLRGLPRWKALPLSLETPGPEGDKVLVVAVERADLLVWAAEKAAPVLYLRIGDSTVRADEWLIHDLVIGRRRVPRLVASFVTATKHSSLGELRPTTPEGPRLMDGEWHFRVHNDSLAWADELQVWALGRVNGREGLSDAPAGLMREVRDVTPENRRHLDVQFGELMLEYADSQKPAVHSRSVPSLGTVAVHVSLEIPYADKYELPETGRSAFVWYGALCLVTRNDLPRWVQLRAKSRLLVADELRLDVWTLQESERPFLFWGAECELSDEDRAFVRTLEARADHAAG